MSISIASFIVSAPRMGERFAGRTLPIPGSLLAVRDLLPATGGSLLERRDAVVEGREPFEARHEPAPAARLLEGNAGRVYPRPSDRMADHRRARDDDAVTDREPP